MTWHDVICKNGENGKKWKKKEKKEKTQMNRSRKGEKIKNNKKKTDCVNLCQFMMWHDMT